MQITVSYQTGKVDIFSTVDFTAADPWARKGTNLLTEYSPRLDLLEEEGLVIDTFWYDGSDAPEAIEVDDDDTKLSIKHAVRRLGRRFLLVSKAELDQIAQIKVDGELVAWRQGGFLINGTKFKTQSQICLSNDTATSLNRQASTLFAYLQNANPGLSDETIAYQMGFPLEVIQQIREAEEANLDDEGDDDWE